jgi:hypothetical protein
VAAEHHDVEAIARRGTAIEMDGWHCPETVARGADTRSAHVRTGAESAQTIRENATDSKTHAYRRTR